MTGLFATEPVVALWRFGTRMRTESTWRFGTLPHAQSGEMPYIQHFISAP